MGRVGESRLMGRVLGVASGVVKRVGDVQRASSRMTVTRALGSSDPAAMTPRGRWYLNERPNTRTPFASKAEASVSPAKPL